jgi:hypothetical protein
MRSLHHVAGKHHEPHSAAQTTDIGPIAEGGHRLVQLSICSYSPASCTHASSCTPALRGCAQREYVMSKPFLCISFNPSSASSSISSAPPQLTLSSPPFIVLFGAPACLLLHTNTSRPPPSPSSSSSAFEISMKAFRLRLAAEIGGV